MKAVRKRHPLSVRGICGGYEMLDFSEAALRSQIHAVVEECLTPSVIDVCRDRDKLQWLLCMIRQEFDYAVKYANATGGPTVLEREENGYYESLVPKKEA